MRKIKKMLLKAIRRNGVRKGNSEGKDEVRNSGLQYIKQKCVFI